MTICGIEIKGSEAIFAMAAQSANGLEHRANATKKIALDDDDESVNVKAFAMQIAAFVKANGITRIAIKKRSKKGEFSGGPTTFKIEGIAYTGEGVLFNSQWLDGLSIPDGKEKVGAVGKVGPQQFTVFEAHSLQGGVTQLNVA